MDEHRIPKRILEIKMSGRSPWGRPTHTMDIPS
jgi:hypothetical protein